MGRAFEQKRPTNHSAEQERIAYLEKKIQTKDEVLAELTAGSPPQWATRGTALHRTRMMSEIRKRTSFSG